MAHTSRRRHKRPRGEGPRDNLVHVGAREGRHVADRFAYEGPTGIVGPGKNFGAVTQMRYRALKFIHAKFDNFLRVGLSPTRSLPLQMTWTDGEHGIR